jgi:SulP family sulfate permease
MTLSLSQLRTEILSGLTISVALVPEAISFALLVGAAPQVGLWAAVFMAASTALFGGRPGLISGATGATAVILAALVKSHGMDSLFLGVVLAGLIQLIIWATNLWKAFDKIPHIAMSGFLIALAIMIFTSQLEYLHIGNPGPAKLAILIGAIIASAVAMWVSMKRFKFPPALAAILAGIAIGIPLGLPTVGDLSPVSAALPAFVVPSVNLNLLIAVIPYSFGVAVSGLTESLIAVGDGGSKRRETLAQSIGNIFSGFFSSMGGCVLIGQSNLNQTAGAKHRLSGISAAVGLIAIIMLFGEWIEQIPLAGLIGVMMIVVIQTGDWRALLTLDINKMIVIFTTTILSLVTGNLAIGVISGTIVYYLVKRYSTWQEQQ